MTPLQEAWLGSGEAGSGCQLPAGLGNLGCRPQACGSRGPLFCSQTLQSKGGCTPPRPHGRQPGLLPPGGSLITGFLSLAEAILALTTVTAPCSRVLPLLTASATCRYQASLTAPTPHPTTWALGSLVRLTQRSLWFPTLCALHPIPPATREDLMPGAGWGVTATGAQRVRQSWAGSPLSLPEPPSACGAGVGGF